MKVYEVYGLGDTRIQEHDVHSMDSEWVWLTENKRCQRFTSFGSYQFTMKDALYDAISITAKKIALLERNLSQLTEAHNAEIEKVFEKEQS